MVSIIKGPAALKPRSVLVEVFQQADHVFSAGRGLVSLILFIHPGKGGKQLVKGIEQVLHKLRDKDAATVLPDQRHVILYRHGQLGNGYVWPAQPFTVPVVEPIQNGLFIGALQCWPID